MKPLLNQLIELSFKASKAIMDIYQSGSKASIKSDGSPVTAADIASHEILCAGIRRLCPNTLIISEEDKQQCKPPYPPQFFLVDPLDGTKEFISKNGEFTTNIALIDKGEPVLGVICCPAQNICYAGIAGIGAFKITPDGKQAVINVSQASNEGIIVTGSRSHGDKVAMDKLLNGKKVKAFIAAGSSLKFCRVAEGSAHLYPRLGRTMEWDTAAGHAILLAAGGSVETLAGEPLLYGKSAVLDNPHFIAKN